MFERDQRLSDAYFASFGFLINFDTTSAQGQSVIEGRSEVLNQPSLNKYEFGRPDCRKAAD